MSATSWVHTFGATAARYCWKFSVVPDLSERDTVVMSVPGSVTPGLSAAMAGSFHLVMSWFMIFASVSGDSWRESTPLRL